MAVDLYGSGLLAGGFEFDEGDVVSGEDGESVGDADHGCGVKFEADAAMLLDCFFKLLFDCLFTHWHTPLAGQGRKFSYIGLVLGILLPVSLFFLSISHKVLHLTFLSVCPKSIVSPANARFLLGTTFGTAIFFVPTVPVSLAGDKTLITVVHPLLSPLLLP